MVDILEVTVRTTDKVMKITSSVVTLARIMKVKPADLVAALSDKEADEAYRASMVTFAIPFELDKAKAADEAAKKEAAKK